MPPVRWPPLPAPPHGCGVSRVKDSSHRFNGRSIAGWVLTIGGLLFILLGVLANMDIYFERTSLWNTLIMLGLVAAGVGLVFRSLRPY